MKELKNWFRKKGYPEKVIREQVNRALRSEENAKEKDGQDMKGNSDKCCNYKCLIYLLSFKVCGLQYVGSTTDKFHFRWNN